MKDYSEIKKKWYEANRSWIDECADGGDYEYVDMVWQNSSAYAEYEDAMAIVEDRFFGFGTEDGDIENRYAIDNVEMDYARIAEYRDFALVGSDKNVQDYAWEMILREEEAIERLIRNSK